jgi:hypothetical protein
MLGRRPSKGHLGLRPKLGQRPGYPIYWRSILRPPSVRRKAPRARRARGASPALRHPPHEFPPRRAGVRPAGLLAHTPSSAERDHGSRSVLHGRAGGAGSLHTRLTVRRDRGHGAPGCGRPAPARPKPLQQITLSTKAESQHKFHLSPASRPGTARRRQGPDSPAWPAPSQPLAKAMGHGPGSALGCAGSATVLPLNFP